MTPKRLADLEAMLDMVDSEDRGVACYARDGLEDAVPELIAEVKRLTARNARLQRDSDWLACLEAAGVDNWEGISAAHEIAEGVEDEDDDAVD